MVWPFGRKLSPSDRAVSREVIVHLQALAAFQQLTMEIYNDAVLGSSAVVTGGDQVLVRGTASLSNPAAVSKVLLPAIERKLDILQSAAREHEAFQAPDDAKEAKTCLELFGDFLKVALARGRLQQRSFQEWQADPTVDVSRQSMSLDRAESNAMNSAIDRLNGFIRRAGYAGEPWLELNCEAFNRVRARIGLDPLTSEQFGSLFLLNMTGQRTRFFD